VTSRVCTRMTAVSYADWPLGVPPSTLPLVRTFRSIDLAPSRSRQPPQSRPGFRCNPAPKADSCVGLVRGCRRARRTCRARAPSLAWSTFTERTSPSEVWRGETADRDRARVAVMTGTSSPSRRAATLSRTLRRRPASLLVSCQHIRTRYGAPDPVRREIQRLRDRYDLWAVAPRDVQIVVDGAEVGRYLAATAPTAP